MFSIQEEVLFVSHSPARRRCDEDKLSLIRSHAQAYVQRRRRPVFGSKKDRSREGGVMSPESRRSTTKPPQPDETDSLHVVKHGCQRRTRCSETSTVTLARGSFEPFNSFPVSVDEAFVSLFERYYRGYRWDAYKPDLFRETASDPKLYHSFLAIAYNMFSQDKIKAIEHETEAIMSISRGLKQAKIDDEADSTSKEAITWAISRLAMIRSQQGDWDTALKHINACALTCSSISDLAAYKFAAHIHCTHSVLLLTNLSRIHGVNAQLRRPYGDTGRSALADVEAQGFKLPLAALLSLKHLKVDSQLLDVLCAMIALCHPAKCTPVFHDTLGIQQAVELLKLAVHLAEMCTDLQSGDATGQDPEWRIELQTCTRLTSFLFVLCPSPAAQAACKEVRQRLTDGLLKHIIGIAADTGEAVAPPTPLSVLFLWILLVCSTSAQKRSDQLYFSEVIKKHYPYVADASDSAIENWKLSLPLLGVGSNPPPDYFWRLSSEGSKSGSEGGYQSADLASSSQFTKSSRVTLEELSPETFSIEDEFLSF
ncbi:hypothetical protein M409DRAFT_55259 [Zasmidium cellare ATCC 36951]|uniref:Uncharacterized protein n=1 Tax=Zasmidium cellare ATCC 36951 TaxID=1080233 RepID=A0A6A6CFH3_ZASCE|nr:uncharacterized protein M409DRAFT_55259 [Zasmidium cellare ATCC 36951]KAF2165885.1 hypothetical protein M409DRAFT_55259 [Zasmidium cellare ATCC 36951]